MANYPGRNVFSADEERSMRIGSRMKQEVETQRTINDLAPFGTIDRVVKQPGERITDPQGLNRDVRND